MRESLLIACLFSGCVLAPGASDPETAAYREQKIRMLLTEGNKQLGQGDRLGDWDSFDRAQAAYEAARELDSGDARIIDGLGCVAWRKGNPKLAEFYFKRAIELNADYDRPIAHLALVAESRGHRHASLELLRRALQLNPLNFRARNNYAALLMKEGERAELQASPLSKDRSEERSEELSEAHRELLKAYELAGPEEELITRNISLLSKRPGW